MKMPIAIGSAPLRVLAGAAGLAALLAAGAPRAMAAPELLELDLQQLSELTVTSVSRKEESLGRAPAAVYVVTAEEIRASGARTLPELLRNVPGLHVARINARAWAVSARGFNGRLADKLEVLQDGRTLYTPLFSGVFWDQQGYALEDIDRIEIIRGPGGTLWGANAVNGVINIITKAAAQTQGGVAAGTHGGEYTGAGTARWGFSPGGAAVRGFVQHHQIGGTQPAGGGVDAPDSWDQTRGGVRGDWRGWTLLAEGYLGEEASAGGPIEVDGAHLQVGKIVEHDSGREEQYQVYFQGGRRDIENGFAEERGTLDVSFQQHWRPGEINDIVWGLGYRRSEDDLRNSAQLVFTPAARTVQLFNGYVQDELHFTPDFSLIVGSKVERNDFTGVEVQPNLRFAWAPAETTTLWGAVSRAVRTPSRLDHDAVIIGGGGGTADGAAADLLGVVDPSLEQEPPTEQDCVDAGGNPLVCATLFGIGGLFPDDQAECEADGGSPTVCAILFDPATSSDLFGDPNFESEELLAFELGTRYRILPALTADLALFYNDYDNLRGVEPVGTNDARIANALRGTAWGGELLLVWHPGAKWAVRQGTSYLNLNLENKPGSRDDRTAASEGNDPRIQAFLKADWLMLDRLALHGSVRHVGALRNLSVDAYTELGLGVSWEPWDRISFDLRGKNLLHADHPEYGGADAGLIERQVFLTVRIGS